LTIKPSNEFNSFGIVSQEMQLRLMALAASDSAAVVSSFTAAADAAGLTEKGRLLRARNDERFLATMRQGMASQERIAEFRRELDRLERASYEAMIEADEKRRIARKELDEIRKRAFEIDMPDGRRVKVFRDGDQVREESGAVIDPSIIKPDDIPKSCPEWEPWKQAQTVADKSEAHYGQAASDYSRVQAAKEATAEGKMTDDELDQLKAEIEPVRHRLDDARPEIKREVMPPNQSVSTPGPG